MRLTRRALLAGIGVMPFGSFGAGASQRSFVDVSSIPALKSLALSRGIDIASAYNGGEPEIERLLAHHCSTITPENDLKAGTLAPDGIEHADPSRMDEIAQFCSGNSLNLHGHTFFWHQSLPGWLDHGDLKSAMSSHARYMDFTTSRYPHIVSWDVVNEPLADDRFGFRNTRLLRQHGPEFLTFLFRHARQAAPNAHLVLNDYGLSCASDYCDRKQSSLLWLIDNLLNTGVPVDAVGIQGHIVPRHPIRQNALSRFLKQIEQFGLSIFVSELDVNDIGLPEDVRRRDQLVADFYRRFLDPVLDNQAVKRVGFWGLSDRSHWIVHGYAPFRRATGTPRPALFDAELNPKPAYFTVADALSHAPYRNPLPTVRS